MNPKIRRALISVSDKMGLADFARGLEKAGVEIYSTGGTRRFLAESGVQAIEVADYTRFPEMMDGRVKTLHPKIFAGILCRHERDDDMNSLNEHDIVPFELVVVNLYPFEATISRPDTTREQAVEQIDIGGPSLVRAAAKNHRYVSIVTSSEQYPQVLEEVEQTGATTLETRTGLMADAFAHTANYDRVIAHYFQSGSDGNFPGQLHLSLDRKSVMRYGENPHQKAALYSIRGKEHACLTSARQLNGKELSYNNLIDLDSALTIARSLPDTACSVIKHNNPCGAASATSVLEAARKAMEGDPLAAFGSILAFNQKVDEATAEYLSTPGLFVEAIAAPDFDAAAVGILTTKPKWRNNVRLMQVGSAEAAGAAVQYRQIDGGILLQEVDNLPDPREDWKVVTEKEPNQELMAEIEFAWEICRHVKSNAITLSRDRALVGCGAGQMSRVDSVEIAIRKAGERSQGAILGSDAFFPFSDSIHRAAEAGVAAIIQPGGSKKDPEVIDACNELGIAMIMTGRRHFRH
ncbi:MAG: bifunctional phosphoribosylaminoimidazolecarboxamide formyltransferase/IMP cyclohydrolase [Planctomycetota bacterium]|nr:bifunctional phosphoribosylaminoimidazolecarboxamide formyltransferase/IMP cyclohydrolase [Planctomycetota bacterium]